MKARSWALALIALLTSSGVAVPASGLECPVPQPLAQPGVLKETQTQIEETGKMLSSGDVDQQTQATIADLRNRYPNVENAELVNYIITAYCPGIARATALSEAKKKAKMDQFVRQLITPRATEPKGDWWAVFHDPVLDWLESAVAVSNQTVKADESQSSIRWPPTSRRANTR